MEQTKLTIRLPRALVEGAKLYAKKHQTSLTRLILAYLRQLDSQEDPLADAPAVRRATAGGLCRLLRTHPLQPHPVVTGSAHRRAGLLYADAAAALPGVFEGGRVDVVLRGVRYREPRQVRRIHLRCR